MNPHILKRPIITEKSYKLASSLHAYTFEVAREATKDQIRAAIEQVFPVHVVGIRTIMSQEKTRRTGKKRMTTKSAKTKRAVVTLKDNETISLFDIGSES